MDAQNMINALLGLVAFFGGWVLHSFKSQLRDNKDDIRKTEERVHAVEVLVAGKYMTREESAQQNEVLLKKLDTIQADIRSCMLHNRRKDDTCEP